MRILMIVATALLVACAPMPPSASVAPPEGMHVTLVLARQAIKGQGPLGVGDRFFLEGKIVAYATYTWSDPKTPWGAQKIETRWYHGDALVLQQEGVHNFSTSPFYAWSQIFPTALGPGPAHVEVYWNGRKLTERNFEVIDQREAPPPRPSGAPA